MRRERRRAEGRTYSRGRLGPIPCLADPAPSKTSVDRTTSTYICNGTCGKRNNKERRLFSQPKNVYYPVLRLTLLYTTSFFRHHGTLLLRRCRKTPDLNYPPSTLCTRPSTEKQTVRRGEGLDKTFRPNKISPLLLPNHQKFLVTFNGRSSNPLRSVRGDDLRKHCLKSRSSLLLSLTHLWTKKNFLKKSPGILPSKPFD